MNKWKIVCGYTAQDKEIIDKELIQAAKRRNKNMEVELIHRYRKEGIYEYLKEHLEVQTVVLQEVLQQSSPYTVEDLIQLTDERHVNVVVSLSENHYGSDFMVVLYNAGIYNAVFEKDASADYLIQLIIQARTRKEARQYYGIHDFIDNIQTNYDYSESNPIVVESKSSLFSVFKKEKESEKEENVSTDEKEADLSDLGGNVYQRKGDKWREYDRVKGD